MAAAPGGERAGLLFAALCAALGAFVPGFAKLTTGAADALFVAAATSVFAGLAGLAVLAARRELGRLFAARDLVSLAAIGTLGTAATYWLFFEGARRTSAIEAVLCLQVEPIYALVAARVALGHRLSARRVAAVAAIAVGIATALEPPDVSASVGIALLLATPLGWQASHLIVLRRLRHVSPRTLTAARYVFGGGVLAGAWAAGGGTAALPEWTSLGPLLPALAIQGVLLSFVGTMLWYETISRLDLARSTAIVVPSVPLLSLGASFVLLGEVATARQWAGLLLTAAGVLAFVTAPAAADARERIPQAMAPVTVPADVPPAGGAGSGSARAPTPPRPEG